MKMNDKEKFDVGNRKFNAIKNKKNTAAKDNKKVYKSSV